MAVNNIDQATYIAQRQATSSEVENLAVSGADAIDDLDSQMATLFDNLDTAFPDQTIRANFKTELTNAQNLIRDNDPSVASVLETIRQQWRNAVPEVDTITEQLLINPLYNIYDQAPNVDGILEADGTYSPVIKSKEPFVAVQNPPIAITPAPTVIDNTANMLGNTVVSFNQYNAYKNALRAELDAEIEKVISANNYEKSIAPTIDTRTRLNLQQQSTAAGYDKGLGLLKYAKDFGISQLSEEQIIELNNFSLVETKILGYTRVRKVLQFIINYMFEKSKFNLDPDLDMIFQAGVNLAKQNIVKERLFGIAFTGSDENYLTIFGYTFNNLISRESPAFVDTQFNGVDVTILNIFKKYKQELININYYELNTIGGPEFQYTSNMVDESSRFSQSGFIPHTMYDPVTGVAYFAATYADHIRFAALGYTHTPPVITTTEETSSTTTEDTANTIPNVETYSY